MPQERGSPASLGSEAVKARLAAHPQVGRSGKVLHAGGELDAVDEWGDQNALVSP